MKKWQEFEDEVFDLLIERFDGLVLKGGSNSNESDVLTPEGYYIDIKMPISQCGQSVDQSEFEKIRKDPRKWVQNYYVAKFVKYWATKVGNELILTNPADEHWNIECPQPRKKRSGTRPLNKKWAEEAEKVIESPIIESNKVFFVRGDFKDKQKFDSPLGETFILSDCGNNYFSVRIRGKTETETLVLKCRLRILDQLTFIDLFAGIGGWRLAAERLGGECVFSVENNKEAIKTYSANFGKVAPIDVTLLNERGLPSADIVFASFPCQAFSIAGKQQGFEDTRGTLVFDVLRIVKYLSPSFVFMENVDRFETHDSGRTWSVVKKAFEDLGYNIKGKTLKSSDFGSPQERKRFYMIAAKDSSPIFPEKIPLTITLEDLLDENEGQPQADFTLSPSAHGTRVAIVAEGRQGERIYNTGIAKTITATGGGRFAKTGGYLTADGPRTLSIREAARLMGFPDDFIFPVSENQAYKQLGNSVSVDIVEAILIANAENLKRGIKWQEKH